VATFTTTGSSVKIGSTVQVSGTTANDFTGPIIYTVTAADGSTATYTVSVTADKALWARTVSTGTSLSEFYSIAVDSGGNVYAAGSIKFTGTYRFGSGVTAAGTYNSGDNVVLVKYLK
jgi:hypothetical protein